MERRFEIRKREIPRFIGVAKGMLKRLEQFAAPFIASLARREPKEHAQVYLAGLLSDMQRKNVESIPMRHRDETSGHCSKNWHDRLEPNSAKTRV